MWQMLAFYRVKWVAKAACAWHAYGPKCECIHYYLQGYAALRTWLCVANCIRVCVQLTAYVSVCSSLDALLCAAECVRVCEQLTVFMYVRCSLRTCVPPCTAKVTRSFTRGTAERCSTGSSRSRSRYAVMPPDSLPPARVTSITACTCQGHSGSPPSLPAPARDTQGHFHHRLRLPGTLSGTSVTAFTCQGHSGSLPSSPSLARNTQGHFHHHLHLPGVLRVISITAFNCHGHSWWLPSQSSSSRDTQGHFHHRLHLPGTLRVTSITAYTWQGHSGSPPSPSLSARTGRVTHITSSTCQREQSHTHHVFHLPARAESHTSRLPPASANRVTHITSSTCQRDQSHVLGNEHSNAYFI